MLRGFLSPDALRGGSDLPGRRPRRPGGAALAAADRRATPSSTRSRHPAPCLTAAWSTRHAGDRRRRRAAGRAAVADRRHPARGQGRRAPGRDHPRRRARARRPRRRPCSSRPTPAPTPRSPTPSTRAAGAEIVADADDVWARAGHGAQGEGAAGGRVRPPPARPRALHLPPPRRVPAGGRRRCSSTARPASRTRPSRSNGALPLLAPMSEVAGRMATQVGARFLERELGGRGVLLGGVPGVRPARVVVLGAGNVGWNARGSPRAWRPRCSCSTRTSTGCAGSTRSTRAASSPWRQQPRRGRARGRRRRPRHRRGARPGRARADRRHRGHGARR